MVPTGMESVYLRSRSLLFACIAHPGNRQGLRRAFSAAVLATGVTLLLVGTAAFGAMLALRTTSVLDNTRKEYKDNGVGLTTLTAATGLLLGAALTLGGVVGIILL